MTHWKRPHSWEILKAGEGDDRGWDGWMASSTRWTWVWTSSRSWWWIGKPGVLQSMGLQRVRHHWVTELNSWKVIQLLVCSNFETFKCFLYLGAMNCVWLCENKCLIKCLCEKLSMCWQGCCRFLATVCPRHCRGKESTCQCRISKRYRFHLWVGKIPWRRKWQSTPVFLSG